MKHGHRGLAATAVLLATAASAGADDTPYCNYFITSVPFTITTQGHYCFNRNLSIAATSGAAITIDANYVLLDLLNYKLGGGSAGPATDAAGIYANGRSNITIRSGNIRGFAFGIQITSSPTAVATGIVVEGNVLSDNTKVGVLVNGVGVEIRSNTVFNTGGSTSTSQFCPQADAGSGYAWGITTLSPQCETSPGPAEVISNTVSNTIGPVASPQFAGGLNVAGESKGLARANRVMHAGTYGIIGNVCRDNDVTDTPNAYSCVLVGTTNSAN